MYLKNPIKNPLYPRIIKFGLDDDMDKFLECSLSGRIVRGYYAAIDIPLWNLGNAIKNELKKSN